MKASILAHRGVRNDPEKREERRQKRLKMLRDVGVLLAIWVVSVLLLNLGGIQVFSGLTVGQRAPETLLAETDFTCVDMAATDLARKDAAAGVASVFRVSMSDVTALERTLLKFADKAASARADPAALDNPLLAEHQLQELADAREVALTGAEAMALFPGGEERVVCDTLIGTLREVAASGIAPDKTSTYGERIDVLVEGSGDVTELRPMAVKSIPQPHEALAKWRTLATNRLEKAGSRVALSPAVVALAEEALRPNLVYDDGMTQRRRDAAADAVPNIAMDVRKGTPLVDRDEKVTPQVVEMVVAHNKRWAEVEPPRARVLKHLGDAALLFIALVICVSWLTTTARQVCESPRRRWLLATLAVLAVALAAFYRYLSVNSELVPQWLLAEAVPMSVLVILAALLLPAPAAMALGLWTSLATALAFNRNFVVLMMGLAGTALVVAVLQGARKRSQVMRAGLYVGLLKAAIAIALAAMTQTALVPLLSQIGTAIGSGLLAAIVAVLVLPLVEWTFNYTTDISLLEYSDMSHPLLRQLAMEAPGTFHHSLMVAAIGQAAANAIGADGLLVAVCAYFHDIGKLTKTEYFTENQRGGVNPHDDLEPTMSAMILHSHVKEGVALARRYHLPHLIVEAISCHHGTTRASFFYGIALRRIPEDERAGLAPSFEASFRYPGPRPRTREQAILMLADSCEAASRSLEKPTDAKMSELVDSIFREKLSDHQLDDCPLTQRELTAVRNSIVFSLTNSLHGRSPYPRENPPAQPTANPSRGEDAAGAPRPPAGRAGVPEDAGAGKPAAPAS